MQMVGALQQEDTQRYAQRSSFLGGGSRRQTIHPPSHCFLRLPLRPKTHWGEGGVIVPQGADTWRPLCTLLSSLLAGLDSRLSLRQGPPLPTIQLFCIPTRACREGKDKAVRSSPDVKLHIPATAAGLVSHQFSS